MCGPRVILTKGYPGSVTARPPSPRASRIGAVVGPPRSPSWCTAPGGRRPSAAPLRPSRGPRSLYLPAPPVAGLVVPEVEIVASPDLHHAVAAADLHGDPEEVSLRKDTRRRWPKVLGGPAQFMASLRGPPRGDQPFNAGSNSRTPPCSS